MSLRGPYRRWVIFQLGRIWWLAPKIRLPIRPVWSSTSLRLGTTSPEEILSSGNRQTGPSDEHRLDGWLRASYKVAKDSYEAATGRVEANFDTQRNHAYLAVKAHGGSTHLVDSWLRRAAMRLLLRL